MASKFLILFSKQDVAGTNIAMKLKECGIAFGFAEYEESLLHLKEPPDCEICLFASRHKSVSGKPCLTAHVPGNWNLAEHGGEPKTLSIAPASKLKVALNSLVKHAKERNFFWQVVAECTHHGPTFQKPSLFVEIGSSENEWNDKTAVEIVASAIVDVVDSEDEFPTAFGVGGPHYTPAFTKIILNKDYAVGHILPQYHVDNIDYETFSQGIEKTVENVDFVLIDWKGLTSAQREKIQNLCEEYGIAWKRTSDL
ncbi:MAG: D-aminoacyl-tRNA deacylase [Candidatus Micrarchaeia archaeon]